MLSRYHPNGYVAPSVDITIPLPNLTLGRQVFIGDRCVLHSINKDDSRIVIGNQTHLYADVIIEVGENSTLTIDDETHIQPRCQLMAYMGSLTIGRRVEMAPNCAFYTYNHGFAPGQPVRQQPCYTKGGITIGNDVWLGVGVVVLDGVSIGDGAVIGAGSVVTRDIPKNAIASGVPARVTQLR
ncbi:transferase [Desulfosarcina ovata subsp. sediminis]|uniref:Transferase n=1 Tax=Desulfosarcina ovata subsp. sediminis TaxID=885957 RepID=A0A5K7ZKS4_9BACT|nr:transferase [Desulfosarcina ovata subsp. sediminis]